MKFNKTIENYKREYRHKIPACYWFDYKFIKKLIKKAVAKYIENNDNKECCICLENDNNLMITFCCNQNIHHTCFVHSLVFSSSPNCPLCRRDIVKAMQYNSTNIKQTFDASVNSIISHIHLNLMKVKNVCDKKLISNPLILKKYKQITHLALTKICKKLNKQLHIDTKEYFLNCSNYQQLY